MDIFQVLALNSTEQHGFGCNIFLPLEFAKSNDVVLVTLHPSEAFGQCHAQISEMSKSFIKRFKSFTPL